MSNAWDNIITIPQGFDRDARLRSIAMNAIRETLIAYQRYDKPFTDNDAVIMDNIFKLLHPNLYTLKTTGQAYYLAIS